MHARRVLFDRNLSSPMCFSQARPSQAGSFKPQSSLQTDSLRPLHSRRGVDARRCGPARENASTMRFGRVDSIAARTPFFCASRNRSGLQTIFIANLPISLVDKSSFAKIARIKMIEDFAISVFILDIANDQCSYRPCADNSVNSWRKAGDEYYIILEGAFYRLLL